MNRKDLAKYFAGTFARKLVRVALVYWANTGGLHGVSNGAVLGESTRGVLRRGLGEYWGGLREDWASIGAVLGEYGASTGREPGEYWGRTGGVVGEYWGSTARACFEGRPSVKF